MQVDIHTLHLVTDKASDGTLFVKNVTPLSTADTTVTKQGNTCTYAKIIVPNAPTK